MQRESCFSVIDCHSVRGPVNMTRPTKDSPNKRGGQRQTDLGRSATGWAPGPREVHASAGTFPHNLVEEGRDVYMKYIYIHRYICASRKTQKASCCFKYYDIISCNIINMI